MSFWATFSWTSPLSDRKVPIDNSFDPEGPVFYTVVHVVCLYSWACSGTRKKNISPLFSSSSFSFVSILSCFYSTFFPKILLVVVFIIRELKQRRRRLWQKRLLKSEFALFQNSLPFFHGISMSNVGEFFRSWILNSCVVLNVLQKTWN